jgi:hypothetical protein
MTKGRNWLRILGITLLVWGIMVMSQLYSFSPEKLSLIELTTRLLPGILPLITGIAILFIVRR